MDDYIKGNLLSILLDKKQDLGKYEYACSVQVPKFTGSEYVINTVDYTAVPGISVGIHAGLNITLSKRLINYIVNHPSDFIDNLCDLPGWDISLKLIVKKGDIHSLAEFEYDIEKLKNKIKSVSDADDIKLLFPETIMCRRYINPKMAKEYATRNNTEKKKAGKKTTDLNNRKFLPLVIKNKNMILDYIEACDLITESNKEYNLKQIKEYCNNTTNMNRYITSLYCLSMKRSYQDKYDNNDAIQSFFYDSTEKGLSVFGEVEKKHFMEKFICNKQ